MSMGTTPDEWEWWTAQDAGDHGSGWRFGIVGHGKSLHGIASSDKTAIREAMRAIESQRRACATRGCEWCNNRRETTR
jgi:hypothetical protein